VLPSHTSSTALAAVQSLPAGVVGQTDKLARLINNHIGPSLGICFGFSASLIASCMPATPKDANRPELREGTEREEELWPEMLRHIYADPVKGLGEDAVMLLQKASAKSGWSDWGDYDLLVPKLVEALRTAGRRLTVDVFYAENDFLIGDAGSKGPRWFDQCWSVPEYGDVIEYSQTTVQGADHDRMWNLRWGAAQTALERVGAGELAQPLEDAVGEHRGES